ncbi:MAG: ATP-binding protein [Myxococcota bacterium]|nr:ATP-binding protein [Myxococcota bacterium]
MSWRRPLRSWLISSHLVVLLLPLIALLGTGALSQDLLIQARISLLDQGALIAMMVSERLEKPDPELDALVETLSARSQTAIRLIDAQGQVIATSGPRLGEDLSAQPEVRKALLGLQAWEVRQAPPPSPERPGPVPSELERSRIYVANPVLVDDVVIGAVLLSQPPRQSLEAMRHMRRFSSGLIAALLLTVGMSLLSSSALSRSLRTLSGAAHRLAEGELSAAGSLDGPRSSRLAEVSELAEAFASMTARLRARLGYVREFASNVSHEFKTPLATLQGTIELLADDADMPQAQRTRFLENAQAEVSRMDALVGGLLSLAQAEEAVVVEPVRLDVLLPQIITRYPGVSWAGGHGEVRGDHRQLEAVAINLIENALRYGAAPVVVSAWEEKGTTGFSVQDAGPGISPANLEQIFDRFFTTDREQGTGLGLALVTAICRAHGGRVAVQSAPGETVFRVELSTS